MARFEADDTAVQACLKYIRESDRYSIETYLRSLGLWINEDSSGTNTKICCPFHPENTPSMMINDEHKIFNCFSCNKSGGIMKLYGYVHDLILKQKKTFYHILNDLLAQDYSMRVNTGFVTIYKSKTHTVEELMNFKNRRFKAPKERPPIETLPELYRKLNAEKLIDEGTTRLAILYAQEGFDPDRIYRLIRNESEEVATPDNMFEGLRIFDALSEEFDWGEL